MTERRSKLAPYDYGEWSCPKCGEQDFAVKYRPQGESPPTRLSWDEHLEFECNECGYRWATRCKDMNDP